ncbi:hypothetical protein CPB86DRAFT_608448 [Serendipita vermifera]|nr:hypothetical protein CPB86DRAFT_608448 [Serendipita vermifera]
MVKTATNPVIEAAAAARSATEKATQTNNRQDIDEAITKWEEVVQTLTDDEASEAQADIFASYASLLLLRWNQTYELKDIRATVSNLEKSLEKLPPSPTKTRYELLTRLGNVHQSWYQRSNTSSNLLPAIQYLEEAYALSVVLRQIKEAANEILPTLANAYFISFQREVSGIDSLHQAINYYQLALVQAQPDIQSRLRMGLGKAYLELMYYDDEVENAQLAIDSFEVVLKKSKEKTELVDASNGKTEGWWWKLITEGKYKLEQQDEDFPFRQWTKNIATTYPDSGVAAAYHAMSFKWISPTSRGELAWYHLAWTLLRGQRRSPPTGFHFLSYRSLYDRHAIEANNKPESGFENLPMLLLALEHLKFLIEGNLRNLYMFQRIQITSRFLSSRHPVHLDAIEWYSWKNEIISELEKERKRCIKSLLEIGSAGKAVTETEEVFRLDLRWRFIFMRPRNFPLQE